LATNGDRTSLGCFQTEEIKQFFLFTHPPQKKITVNPKITQISFNKNAHTSSYDNCYFRYVIILTNKIVVTIVFLVILAEAINLKDNVSKIADI